MWWNILCGEVSHSRPVIGVCPQILRNGDTSDLVVNLLFAKKITHPNRILSSSADERRLGEVEGHGRGNIKGIELVACTSDG